MGTNLKKNILFIGGDILQIKKEMIIVTRMNGAFTNERKLSLACRYTCLYFTKGAICLRTKLNSCNCKRDLHDSIGNVQCCLSKGKLVKFKIHDTTKDIL